MKLEVKLIRVRRTEESCIIRTNHVRVVWVYGLTWNCPLNSDNDNDINIEVQMAEAIATEGADHDDEETEDQDIAEIQIKGSIKTDEVKATHIFIWPLATILSTTICYQHVC